MVLKDAKINYEFTFKVKGKRPRPAIEKYNDADRFVNCHLAEYVDITKHYTYPYINWLYYSKDIIRFDKFSDYVNSPYYEIDQKLDHTQVTFYIFKKSSAYLRATITKENYEKLQEDFI